MTNKERAESNTDFIEACNKVGLPFQRYGAKQGVKNSLTRQASKWRRKIGLAWKEGRQ